MGLSSSFTHSLGSIAGGAIGGIFGGAGGAYAGSVIGGMLGPSQERMDKRNYNYQLKKSIQAWDLQNAYNSPVQQMQRLREAGLNPMLVYGSGNVTGNAAGSIDIPTLGSSDVMSGANQISGLAGELASNSFKQNMQEQRIAAQQGMQNNELDIQLKQARLEYLRKVIEGKTGPHGNVTKPDPVVDSSTTIEEIMNNPTLTTKEKRQAVSLIRAGEDKKTGFSTDPIAYIGRVFGGALGVGSKYALKLRNKLANNPNWVVEPGYLPYRR